MQYVVEDMRVFNSYLTQTFKNKEVEVIFDVGACHALESVELSKKYPNAKVYTFEANPVSYNVCLENTEGYDSITVINEAVNDYDGVCKFYPMDKEKTITTWEDGNQGASSLYRANGQYDFIEKYVQYEIEVPYNVSDTFCERNGIDKIDIIWMDLQGAELKALQSLGSLLDTVQIIHTELEMNPMYEGQCLFSDVNEYLTNNGFDLEYGDTNVQFGSNFIFTNQR